MTVRQITTDEAQLFADRLTAEAAHAGMPVINVTGGQVLDLIAAGDLFLLDDGAGGLIEPQRVCVWLHPDTAGNVLILHLWCPGTRDLELFGKVTDFCLARGFVTAKFVATPGMPIPARAIQILKTLLNPDGTRSVSLKQTRAILTAMGVP